MKAKICNPDGTSVESRMRRLRRYIESRRDDFDDVELFTQWAVRTTKNAMNNIARFCYLELD